MGTLRFLAITLGLGLVSLTGCGDMATEHDQTTTQQEEKFRTNFIGSTGVVKLGYDQVVGTVQVGGFYYDSRSAFANATTQALTFAGVVPGEGRGEIYIDGRWQIGDRSGKLEGGVIGEADLQKSGIELRGGIPVGVAHIEIFAKRTSINSLPRGQAEIWPVAVRAVVDGQPYISKIAPSITSKSLYQIK